MFCCFGGSSSRKHQRNNPQTVSKIDPLVLPQGVRTIDIAPDSVPPPTPAAPPARATVRRPPSPTDPILPGVAARTSPTGRNRRDDHAYPPAAAQPFSPAENGPRIVQVHRPRTADGRSSRRPSSPRDSSTTNSRTTQTNITTPDSVAPAGGRTLRGASRDEKRSARRQASTPQLRHARTESESLSQRAPTTVSAPSRVNMSHARSYSTLGTTTSPGSMLAPALPPVVPTSPLLGPSEWLPASAAASRSRLDLAAYTAPPAPVVVHPASSPIIRPSAVPIVVHRVTVATRTPHIDLLSGTVLRPGQDPPPRYEAG